jgi:AcrR family transcriptional regulator
MAAGQGTETNARRGQIVDVAMRQFAEHGYRGAHVEDIAAEVGVAKGTVFLHFGNKEGLFLAVYREAVGQLPAWLDAPADVVEGGFWSVLDYWLRRTEEFLTEQWVANRVAMIGRYDTGLGLRRPIDRLMRSEDPYGTLEFVEFGVRRGEIRDDVDVEMIASMLDWVAERFQDALGSEELDPGLVHRKPHVPERRDARIREFLELLRSGISPAPRPIAEPDRATAGQPATMERARRGRADR